MNRKFLSLCTVAAGAMMWAQAANADLITVGLQEAGQNSGNITVAGIATQGNFQWPTGVTYGIFHTQGNAFAPPSHGVFPPEIMTSTSVDFTTSGAGELKVFVTAQGQTAASSSIRLLSHFGLSNISPGMRVIETNWIDTSNGLYNGATPPNCTPPGPALPLPQDECFEMAGTSASGLNTSDSIGNSGTLTFSSLGSLVFSPSISLSGPFSLTEEYDIIASGAGQTASLTDSINTVPEPASLSLFGVALLGFAASLRRKRKGALPQV